MLDRTAHLFGIMLVLLGIVVGPTMAQTTHDTTGPYKVLMEEDPSLPGFTTYHPENVADVKGKLPIVAWANGGCMNSGNFAEPYLSEIASHGYLVIAIGPIDPAVPEVIAKLKAAAAHPGQAPAMPGPFTPKPAGTAAKRTSSTQLIAAVAWARAQNTKERSAYKGKLATEAVAVSGTSCGGLQALEAAADPNVRTALLLNTGVLRTPPQGAPPGFTMPGGVEYLKKLHTPVIYIIGGPGDIAYKNADGDYEEISVPLFRADINVGHNGTVLEPHGGKFAEVMTQWLEWQLKGDKKAAAMFTGEKCGLCTSQEWTVRRKNLK